MTQKKFKSFILLLVISLPISGWGATNNSTLRSPSALTRELTPTEAPILDEHAPQNEPRVPLSNPKSSELTELPALPDTEPLSEWARDTLLELPEGSTTSGSKTTSKRPLPKKVPAKTEAKP